VPRRSVEKSTRPRRPVTSAKPAARRKKAGGKGDFGIPPDKLAVERDRLEEMRHRHGVSSDIDDRPPRAGSQTRVAGVGGREAGPGSYSGGDVDSDIVGVAGGSGLAESVSPKGRRRASRQ